MDLVTDTKFGGMSETSHVLDLWPHTEVRP